MILITRLLNASQILALAFGLVAIFANLLFPHFSAISENYFIPQYWGLSVVYILVFSGIVLKICYILKGDHRLTWFFGLVVLALYSWSVIYGVCGILILVTDLLRRWLLESRDAH